MTVPLLLLKPRAAGAQRAPVVVGFAQNGKEAFLSDRSAEVSSLLKRGVALCLADVRGSGESASTTPRGSGLTSLAATELMLGNTALGGRLKDARTVVRYLSTRSDLDAKRLAVWGDSFAEVNSQEFLLDQSLKQQPGPQTIHEAEPMGSLLAVLTALYEDNVRAVAARGGLVSYLSVLQDRFSYVPQDIIVPGILEIADIPDLIAAIAPRAELIDGAVDGRDRTLSPSEMQGQLRPVITYGSGTPQLLVRDRGAKPELAEWIASHL
jgi:hypothetical protein